MKSVNIFAFIFEEERIQRTRNSLGGGFKSNGSHAKLRFYSGDRWESKHRAGRDYKCTVEF